MRRDEIRAVSELHCELFGGPDNVHSLARLGPTFLADVFYGPSFDNPHFHVDVARDGTRLVAFSVYITDPHVYRQTLLRHPIAIAMGLLKAVVRQPVNVARRVMHNVTFVSSALPPEVADLRGQFLLLSVLPDYRRLKLAGECWMRMERGMRSAGCSAMWAAAVAHSPAIHRLLAAFDARPVATGSVQGIECIYYVKDISTQPQ